MNGARREVALGEVTESLVEQRRPSGPGSFVYVDIGSIDRITKRIVAPKAIPNAEAPSRARQVLRAGDVLVSMTRPNLNAVTLVPPELDGAVGSTGFHVLRPQGVESAYLHYLVQTNAFVSAMSSVVQGALYPAVRPKDVSSFRFLLPSSLEAHRQIVAQIETQFSRLDAGVAALKRAHANLKRYRASVLKAACEGRLVPTEAEIARREGREYETGAQLLERILVERRKAWTGKGKYKEPEPPDTTGLPELPEGWCWATVGQVGSVRLGKMLDKAKHRSGDLLPYLRNVNVRWGRVETEDLLSMYYEEHERDRYSVVAGDILVCEGGEPGRSAIWQRPESVMYQKALHRLRLHGGFARPLVIYWLEHLARTRRLDSWFTGSTIKHFTAESFARLPMPVPPVLEQQRIVDEVERRLSVADQLDATIATGLQRAARLRQAVLQKAFGAPGDPA